VELCFKLFYEVLSEDCDQKCKESFTVNKRIVFVESWCIFAECYARFSHGLGVRYISILY